MKTDAQLIRDARTEPHALGELYSRHARTIHRWLLRRTPERIAVELTAETFAQAALSLKRFRDEANGSAAPWLFGIARNLLRKYLEHERVETKARSKLGMPESYELDLDAAVERVDAARLAPALRSALAELPSGQRDALELRGAARDRSALHCSADDHALDLLRRRRDDEHAGATENEQKRRTPSHLAFFRLRSYTGDGSSVPFLHAIDPGPACSITTPHGAIRARHARLVPCACGSSSHSPASGR